MKGCGETTIPKSAKQRKKFSASRKSKDNRPQFDLGVELARLMGVDLRIIDGIDLITAQVIYSEVGPDLSAWPTEGHFASWLELCPRRDVSGGKVIKQEKRQVKSRVANALMKRGADAEAGSDSYLWGFGINISISVWRTGKPPRPWRAISACLIYRLLTKGAEWAGSRGCVL